MTRKEMIKEAKRLGLICENKSDNSSMIVLKELVKKCNNGNYGDLATMQVFFIGRVGASIA